MRVRVGTLVWYTRVAMRHGRRGNAGRSRGRRSSRSTRRSSRRDVARRSRLICVTLACVTVATYGSVIFHDFVGYDDQVYVTDNPLVQAGITWNGVRLAVQSTVASNWHPVTLLSHMLDWQLFGLWAGGHHLTSLVLHVLNVLLLFRILERITGATWRSAFVAALFAWHPLHVESVAWIAERKDVLSTFFGLLSVSAYVRYAEERGHRPATLDAGARSPLVVTRTTRFYVVSLVFFGLGLLSKPMLVTLPFVFLLLDYWPLQRIALPASSFSDRTRTTDDGRLPIIRPASILVEKVPFLLLSAAFSVITFVVQKRTGAMVLMDAFPLEVRVANALVSYCRYIAATFWPVGLAVFYPFRSSWPTVAVSSATLCLAGATVLAIGFSRGRRYLAVGWLWFIGTLVPVIGIVQVGTQAMADRFTYLPLVGVFIMLAWGGEELFARNASRLRYAPWFAGGVLGGCAVLTSIQCTYWRDTEVLFQHALAVTTDNAVAEYGLGRARLVRGDLDGALRHYANAVKIEPNHVDALTDLGSILIMKGEVAAGVQRYRDALRANPDSVLALSNLGWTLATHPDSHVRNGAEAVQLAEKACALSGWRDARFLATLDVAYAETGRFDEAERVARMAQDAALASADPTIARAATVRLELYRRGLPYRE